MGDVDRLRRSLVGTVRVEETFPLARAGIALWLKALRIHQWAKNALVFVPLLLSGHATAGAYRVLDTCVRDVWPRRIRHLHD